MSGRVGIGYDVHPFASENGRALILGGVFFPGEQGLAGHSDADVVAHAVADAMLGAAGLGDLGTHFADTDERWAGASSIDILTAVADIVGKSGYRLSNADCTVVGERPRLAPVRAEMIERLSAAARGPVHVKATRPERLGALGREEGIACVAVALLEEMKR
ncbi:MAG: 2-C-methyl-D-erythritol 2,4-cyclodiphosphate synthase [Actinomycetota bacterium]|nr:2-C-methyl-D-erythritol 2,4-cyclodiphosphate synthase [Actinomycetota bacterium]